MRIIIAIILMALVCLGCAEKNSQTIQHSKPWAELKAHGFFVLEQSFNDANFI